MDCRRRPLGGLNQCSVAQMDVAVGRVTQDTPHHRQALASYHRLRREAVTQAVPADADGADRPGRRPAGEHERAVVVAAWDAVDHDARGRTAERLARLGRGTRLMVRAYSLVGLCELKDSYGEGDHAEDG